MTKYEDTELNYDLDARSVHTVLRVINPDDHSDTNEMLFDNLTTPMAIVFGEGLRIRQETIGFSNSPTAEQLGGGMTDEDHERGVEAIVEDADASKRVAASMLGGWREHVSGSTDEALIVEAYGDPKVLDLV